MKLFVAAMPSEIDDIMKLSHQHHMICLTGIGKVNAAIKLTQYLNQHQVDAIYNIGFAGASSHFEVGDIVIIKEAAYHDFDLTLFGYEKGQVPGCPLYFQSDTKLLTDLIKIFPDAKKETLYTGDYFMTESKHQHFVVDMEGAALYQTAWHHQIPIISIKVISDIVGMDEHYASYQKFEAQQGSKTLLEVYQKILDLS